MALSITLDRDPAVYAPGDTITLTATVGPGERDRFSETPAAVTVSVLGGGEGTTTLTLRQPIGPAAITCTDDTGRVWTKTEDDGVTSVFTATA
jgi:hypothetical protein